MGMDKNTEQRASPYLDDRETVLAAVRDHGFSLEYVGKKNQDDREIVLAALGNELRPWDFQYASERLRDDEGIALAYIVRNGLNLNFASERIRELIGESDPVATLQALMERR